MHPLARRLGCFVLTGATCGHPTIARSSEATSLILRPGETKTVYSSVNLKGKIYLSIRAHGGSGCARLFWITWPTNRVVGGGDYCGTVRLETPTIKDGALASTLWARALTTSVQIVGSSNESIVIDFPKVTFP